MRKVRILLFSGIWIAVLPYLGFPYFWKNILLTLSGFGLIYVSFLLYREFQSQEKNSVDTFSENSDWNGGELKTEQGASAENI